MKRMVEIIITMLFIIAIIMQSYAQQIDSSSKFIDYRNRINIPEYDPSLMPLNYNNKTTGVWTELNPRVPRVNYIGLHFVNKDTGWACGANGAIIKTTNGGKNWIIGNTPVNNMLLKIHSYNGRIVIATGFNGVILRSTDGGENFERILLSGTTSDLWGIKMLNDTLGWICGLNQTLLKTTDGGVTWQTINTGLNGHYWAVDFMQPPLGNEQYGMIACAGGKVLKTTDGGNNWTHLQAGDTKAIYTIDIIDSLHIAAAGESGKNVYSSDGGITWISNFRLSRAVNGISFINKDTGYSVQTVTGIRKTTDRGQTWLNPLSTYLISDWHIQLLEDGTGYACGEEAGSQYSLNLLKQTVGLDNWENVFLNDNFSDVHFITETTGFALSGSLYKTTDAGIKWQRVKNAPGGNDILFLDDHTGFIGGNNIYKTTNGGASWYAVNGVPGGVRKILFINPTTGWAISGSSIIKTTNSGENWFVQVQQGGADSYTSIYFIDSLNGWATSRYIWQTTNGGSNWIQRTDISIIFSLDVFFKDYLNGFAISSNKFYSTIDGGLNWILNPALTGFSVAGKFSVYNNNTIFIIGYKTYRSIDGGVSWFDYSELTGKRINGLSLLGMELGYAAGEFGLLLKYYDETIPVELTSFTAEMVGKNVLLNWATSTETNNYGFEIFCSNDLVSWQSRGFIPGNGTTTSKNVYIFYDSNIYGNNVYYKLKQIDYNGSFSFTNVINVEISVANYFLSQNYPNPFNPNTRIQYAIPSDTKVELKIYDILGREVKTLVNEFQITGRYYNPPPSLRIIVKEFENYKHHLNTF